MPNLHNRLLITAVLGLLAASILAAQVSVVSTPNPSALGQPVTLTASVPLPDVAGPPSVAFYDGANLIAVRPIIGGSATLTTGLLTPGVHALRARYNGAVSAPITQTVSAQASYALRAPGYLPVNSTAQAIVTGDFNGDGRLDVAVAADVVTVLIGDGNGNYRAVVSPLNGINPHIVVTGDFDGDGIADLAISGDTGLYFLKGVGDGGFRAPVTILSQYVSSLAVGDFNADGIADLVANEFGPLVIMLGHSNGFSTSTSPYNVAAGSMAVADFDGDGLPDLAISGWPSSNNTVGIMIGAGDGTFGSPSYFGSASGLFIAAADVNGDGKPDIVAKTGNDAGQDNSFTVLLGTGDGRFGSPMRTLWQAIDPAYVNSADLGSITVSDFNGDGKPDVLVGGSNVQILLGRGDGTFASDSPIIYRVGGGVPAVAAGEWNGDGAADVFFATYTNVGVLTSFSSPRALLAVSVNHDAVVVGAGVVTYSINVSNGAAADPTAGVVMVAQSSILTFQWSGDGWACNGVACTRSDTLQPGRSYPPIRVVLTGVTPGVADASTIVDIVTAIGGGSTPAQSTDTFVIPPLTPVLAGIPDRATTTAPPYTLQWSGPGGDLFDVYLGTSSPPSLVAANIAGNITGDHYDTGALAPCTTYFWKIVSKSNGVGVSSPVRSFTTTPSVTLGRDIFIVPSAGGIGSVSVTSPSSCQWVATNPDAPTLTITSGSGTGNGVVSFSVPPYSGDGSRSWNLKVSDQVLHVIQDGLGTVTRCTTSVSGPAFIDASAQTVMLNVTTDPVCNWSLTAIGNVFVTWPAQMQATTVSVAANTSGASLSTTFHASPPPVPGSLDYPFTMTQRATTNTFADVAPDYTFFDAINLLRGRSITDGCAGAPLRFCPNDNITRGQMAVFIVRSIMGGDNFSYSSTPYFTDTPANYPFFKWIQKMWELGITNGCTPTGYCPNDPVTRGQMAVFIIRARLGATATFSYPDVALFSDTIGNPFYTSIQKMGQLGITTGCAIGQYCPNDPVTRGQMAVFIMRGAFNQLLPAARPIVVSVSPAAASPGQTVTVTITGQNTFFTGGAAQISVGSGITVSGVTVNSATSITAQFSVASSAVLGPRSVTVNVPGEIEATLPNGFRVQ